MPCPFSRSQASRGNRGERRSTTQARLPFDADQGRDRGIGYAQPEGTPGAQFGVNHLHVVHLILQNLTGATSSVPWP
ncbi:hypothetical protein CBM2623_U10031 [Cupriavidus taiwanensis]|nr:hypothetical protein CBM2608_U20003 [Cupriavidus taiwanensis]SPA38257.1 hypothetical protein CBM2623_U10031 [Cupriavidus taiwanensis]